MLQLRPSTAKKKNLVSNWPPNSYSGLSTSKFYDLNTLCQMTCLKDISKHILFILTIYANCAFVRYHTTYWNFAMWKETKDSSFFPLLPSALNFFKISSHEEKRKCKESKRIKYMWVCTSQEKTFYQWSLSLWWKGGRGKTLQLTSASLAH